jgi:hypothetical protein
MYTRKEILRVILDLGFTITLVKRSPVHYTYPQYEWVRARLCKLQKGCTRLASDIAEILLKVALKHQKIKSKADCINNHILNVFEYNFNIQPEYQCRM